MSMAPRIGVLSFILLMATFTPNAAASGCIDIEYTNFGSGLHVIANTGRELAFGFVTAYPGEGAGAVAIITPALCGGVGVGAGWSSAPEIGDVVPEPARTPAHELLVLLPLP